MQVRLSLWASLVRAYMQDDRLETRHIGEEQRGGKTRLGQSY